MHTYPDIDEVGITTRHNTFFQMAGNFSFGDYFKRGAIELAWALLTNSVADGGYGLDPEKLWATVYLDDDEAAGLWREVAGLPADRIQRRGMADNYWSMGIPGPCGPSSEIYYDRARTTGPRAAPSSTRTATSRSGTSCSCRTSGAREPPKRTTRSSARCLARTSTPGWVWSASR
ncbi:tRNA synthetases class II family protein [Mycobacterium ulcerans str. Harvey]|uniref:alanine--tRNA ligase n=1 Tax=Mycobacterium ulcerans str. Harvey TaxID=1299332 RepID=A0ABN0R103_MYCUL|nr:tRNA synthetases class II family protein [Mycobacterium ulcerans str. Harvey]